MTPQEAIEIITNAIQTENMTAEQDKALAIVQKATEKQIAKTAEHEDGAWSICPNCGGSVCNDTEHAVNKEVSYCEHCGQALDWGGEN